MTSFTRAVQLISVPDPEDPNTLVVTKPFAVLTPFRADSNSEDNEKKFKDFSDKIEEKGLKSLTIEGNWHHTEGAQEVPALIPEKAFIIHGNDDPVKFLDMAKELAQEANQPSFLASDGRTVWVQEGKGKGTDYGSVLDLKKSQEAYRTMRKQDVPFVFAGNAMPDVLHALANLLSGKRAVADQGMPPDINVDPPAQKAVPYSSIPKDVKVALQEATDEAGVPKEWAHDKSLLELIYKESSFRPDAKNPASSAFGLFQILKGVWQEVMREYDDIQHGTEDPYWQAVAGYKYIKKRYKTPQRALQFWNATMQRNPDLAPSDMRDKAAYWISKGYVGY